MTSNWRQAMPTQEAYWIDRVLYDVHHRPADLQRYREDAAAYLSAVPMTERSKAMLLTSDIGGLYLLGANPYLLRAHVLGIRMPEPEFLASIRSAAKEAAHG